MFKVFHDANPDFFSYCFLLKTAGEGDEDFVTNDFDIYTFY